MRTIGLRSLILFILLQVALRAERIFFIRDAYSGRPLVQARVIDSRDTLYTALQGEVILPEEWLHRALQVQATGYFNEKITFAELSQPVVYLIPQWQSETIQVVGRSDPSKRPSWYGHTSVIDVRSLQRSGASMEEILQARSGITVKSYGPEGMLQTIALRGMSAEQTQVLLDGVPLNNLQTGSFDLSLLDHLGSGYVEIYRGGHALLGGNGAIGGTLNLKPMQPEDRPKVRLQTNYTTLIDKGLKAQLHMPLAGWRSLILYEHRNGLNRYRARGAEGMLTLRNRDFRLNAVTYIGAGEWGATQRLEVILHHMRRKAGSPRPFNGISEQGNRARLGVDQNIVQLRYEYRSDFGRFSTQIYKRNEWMDYLDSSLVINMQPEQSLHFNKEYGSIIRLQGTLAQRLEWKLGAEYATQFVRSSEAGRHRRDRWAVYSHGDWQIYSGQAIQAITLNGSLRIQGYSHLPVILLPAVGVQASWEYGQWYVSAGRNYRAPGFNDLFWVPGGNPHLHPEKAQSLESGFRLNYFWASFWLQGEAALFQNRVRDQIRWLPDAQGIWRPENMEGVSSRGMEGEIRLSDVASRFEFSFYYTLQRAIKSKGALPEDPTVGNRLPYLPGEQFSATLRLGGEDRALGFTGDYMSFRYTDITNNASQILPSYFTARLWLNFGFRTGRNYWHWSFSVENLFNREYEIIKGYPMPLRHYRLQWTWEW